MGENQHPDREARPKVAVVAPEQAESFAILRRARIESDRLPQSDGAQFEGGLIGRCGFNLDLARRATTSSETYGSFLEAATSPYGWVAARGPTRRSQRVKGW